MTSHQTESAPLNEARVNDFLQRLRAIFNGHDLDALASLMTEDVVFEHPLAGTLHGRVEVRAFYTGFWNAPIWRWNRQTGHSFTRTPPGSPWIV